MHFPSPINYDLNVIKITLCIKILWITPKNYANALCIVCSG